MEAVLGRRPRLNPAPLILLEFSPKVPGFTQIRIYGRLVLGLAAILLQWPGLRAAEMLTITSGSAANEAPIVGAIRWDAWYGGGDVSKAVEKSLGQPKYHRRLPWFAQLKEGDRVQINGDSEEVMSAEISYAVEAGLHYWAFLHYWEESREMGIGLSRYLAARDKKGVRYCLIEEGGRLDKIGVNAWFKLVDHFKSPHYQTVLGGRPLLFVYTKPNALGRDDWDELKRQTEAAGLKVPYLVLMGWDLEQDLKAMAELGFDAISAYARGGSYSMQQPAYMEQCRLLRERFWDKWQTLRVPCVTLASAGWDTRPRNERPPYWIQNLVESPAPDPTLFSEQRPLVDAVTATPDQLASHLLDAIQWTKTHREINASNTIIVYAWNEHDEGGWLQPTRGADGLPDEDRVKAVGKVLRPLSPRPGK